MNNKLLSVLLLLLTVLCAANIAQMVVNEQPQKFSQEQQFQKVIATALRSFVFVEASGSGVIISPDGYVITNDHVAGNGAHWRLRTTDGVLHNADLIGTDPYGDIALLKIRDASNLPFIEFGDSDKVEAGQAVIAIGNPFGLGNLDESPTVTTGIVSALHRFHFNYTDAIMTDTPLNPGNSGGPLITLDGKLVGINGQIASRFDIRASSGIGYAITSNQIQRFLVPLKEANGGFVYHGYLVEHLLPDSRLPRELRYLPGIRIPYHMSEARRTVVLKIEESSSAYQAGLRQNDEIVKVEGYPVTSPSRFIGIVRSYPATSNLRIEVLRNEKPLSLEIPVERYPLPGIAHLGITFYPSQAQATPQVKEVVADSPAAKAGVRVQDIIISFAGRNISMGMLNLMPDLLERLFLNYAHPQTGGALIEPTVIRNGGEVTMSVEVQPGAKQLGIKLNSMQKKKGVLESLAEKILKSDSPNPLAELVVLDVEKGMFADRAGLQRGDVLIEFNNHKLEGREFYQKLLRSSRPGSRVKMKILRGGKPMELTVTLGLKRLHEVH